MVYYSEKRLRMKIAISQSNYIPWPGYFCIIESVDLFIFLEDVQYTRRDWRNRNLVLSMDKAQWLTVPVITKGQYNQQIADVKIDGDQWKRKHLNTIYHEYKSSKHFDDVFTLYSECLEECTESLSSLNINLIKKICNYLSINTLLDSSEKIKSRNQANERLIDICKYYKGTKYISAPAAKNYLDTEMFNKEFIEVELFDYEFINNKLFEMSLSRDGKNLSILHGLMHHGTSLINLLKEK